MPNTVKINLATSGAAHSFSGAVILLVDDAKKLGKTAKDLDKHFDGRISSALKASPRFDGAAGQAVRIPGVGGKVTRIVVLGTGKPKTAHDWNVIGAKAYAAVAAQGDTAALVVGDDISAQHIGHMALGAAMKSYRFDKYKTRQKATDKPSLKTLAFRGDSDAKRALADADAVAEGVALARDMGNEPPNVLNPISAAKIVQQRLAKVGVKVTVVDDKQMEKMGMGCILAVGGGSDTPPRIVVMEYRGAKNKKAAPICVVGKGVTYDTGGINIKLEMNSMHEMKYDMLGAANTIGLVYALAKRKAKVNIVAAGAFAENSVDEDSYRPSDILTSMAGITVDVWNTDAEGRLVLADALWYMQDKFKPHTLVDMATLTGASIIALAHEYGALMSNDDKLADSIYKVGEETGDRFWRLPCGPELDKYLKTEHADLRNVSNAAGSRAGGTITAGRFLHNFVQKGVKWAHLDIANVDMLGHDYDLGPAGPTCHGIRMLNAMIAQHYED